MDLRPLSVLTIGHSSHTIEHFVGLLESAAVTAIADVRTFPFSRHTPQFNQDVLKETLSRANISYAFLGKELGGRPRDRSCFTDGIADYERMAATKSFREGLQRVLGGARKHRVALMCAEHDPLDCHRCLLVGRALASGNVRVEHILADCAIVAHEQIEERLLTISGRGEEDLFHSRPQRLAEAYRDRSRKVAFAESHTKPSAHAAAE